MAAEELFLTLHVFNLITQPGEWRKRQGALLQVSPFPYTCAPPCHVVLRGGPEWKGSGWERCSAGWGGSLNAQRVPVRVSKSSIGGGCGQYLSGGSTRDTEKGGSVIQQFRGVCSSGLQGTGRERSMQGGELGLLQGSRTLAEFLVAEMLNSTG